MKFNEKLLEIRKKQGLSQEELGNELKVSRQTISKWESGQSYPDFQRLVMLSDYLDISIDELVKDIDVQEVRNKNLTDEKILSIFSDIDKFKIIMMKILKISEYLGAIFIIFFVFIILAFIGNILFPNVEWLWNSK